VFQDASMALDPLQSIERCLAEPFEVHRVPFTRGTLEGLLATVQLAAEILGRRPDELSAGQRQRVGLARALALNPTCLVLDEPVSALDVSIQGQIVELLASIRRERTLTLILVSHDLHVIRALATRVAVLFAGRVIEVGPAAAVLASPRHPYSRSLMAGRELSLERSIASEPGCAYRLRCPHRIDACADTPSLSPAPHASACFVMK
jgi:ABC-type glutathione transport system ATPase component